MGLLVKSSIACPHCGADVRLRSFRSSITNKCQNCGQLIDPESDKEVRGSVFFIPLALLSAYAFGWLGYRLGTLLANPLRIADLDSRLAFMLGFDGIAAAMVLYAKWTGHSTAKNQEIRIRLPIASVGVGIVMGSGLGVSGRAILGAANGLIGLMISWPLFLRQQQENRSTFKDEGDVQTE